MAAQEKEPKATWGDVLKGLGVVAVVILFLHIAKKENNNLQYTQKAQQAQKTVDSLVQDSLSKTIEYRNAVRADRLKEQKRNQIWQYFDSIQKTY